jgi:asparagine synthase (glutamine-hydrolysing)
MCGIVGLLDRGQGRLTVEPATLDAMVDSLAHRGPDGRGVWRDGPIALGHRRLAILDPTPAGAQPMLHPSGQYAVAYNGEIYNFRDLRSELESLGHRFRTDCDTEVLLAAYAQWGAAAVARFNGIFAFALWDAVRRRLWLARDRLGVKPLVYAAHGGVLRFASEAKAILADPEFPRRPSPEGLRAFLTFGYVPAPWTGFDGIRQLPPAHEAVVEDGRMTIRPYWALSMRETPRSYPDALDEFQGRLQAAVARQMVSDVPLGGFLSGGVDSAAIVSCMACSTQDTVRSFSVAFAERSFDESARAAATAMRARTDHREIPVSLDLADTLDRLVEFCEDPLADSSSLAVYHLCRAAREHVTVALSGDGADELLAGYPTYQATELACAYRRLPSPLRRLARGCVGLLPVSEKRYALQQFASRFVHGAEEGEGRDFASWRVHLSHAIQTRLCRPDFLAGPCDPIEWYAEHYRAAPEAASRLKRMLYADLVFYLPSDMLVKMDRMSMAHGLEVRVPFLDHELVEFCASLPDRFLVRRFSRRPGKRILRDVLRRQLGPEIHRRPKRGFNVPVESAMRGVLWGRLCEAVHQEKFRRDGPLDVGRLMAFAREHRERRLDAGHALFSVLVLALWWDRWL